MDAAGVPTASFSICDTPAAAQLAIAEADGNVVIKADGLAAGKGVFVCDSVAEAERAVQAPAWSTAASAAPAARVLIEQRLEGPEVSLLALCDGEHGAAAGAGARLQAGAGRRPRPQHRRHGLHLAGAGAGRGHRRGGASSTVHRPVIAELARRGVPFRGCLYAGLMLTDDGPRVLEFNARWGDPETQVLVPRLAGRPAGRAAARGLGQAGRRSADGRPTRPA